MRADAAGRASPLPAVLAFAEADRFDGAGTPGRRTSRPSTGPLPPAHSVPKVPGRSMPKPAVSMMGKGETDGRVARAFGRDLLRP